MTTAADLPRRRRSSLLDSLEAVRAAAPEISLTEIVAYLYVCENEGINMRELSQLCGLTDSMVSRIARALAVPGSPGALPPGRGLLEVRISLYDRRSRTLHLASGGRTLRDRLEASIARATPIVDQLASVGVQRPPSAGPHWPEATRRAAE